MESNSGMVLNLIANQWDRETVGDRYFCFPQFDVSHILCDRLMMIHKSSRVGELNLVL